MKKSILSASIAAMIGGLGLMGAANAAVLVHPTAAATALFTPNNGVGQILFVPYFTTQGTNATLLNITNPDTTNGKVVKVRFRGASNSDDLFDFTLLMSPGDVWAAKISQGANGVSQLETSDTTCTLPEIVRTQVNPFGTSRLNPTLTAAQAANETREGYIEILTMADVPKFANADQVAAAGGPGNGVTAGSTINALWTATKHVSGKAPCTSTVLNTLLTDVTSFSNQATIATAAASAQGKGMTFPSGGLMANYTIIDTVKTATYSGEAEALAANGVPNLVFFPQAGTAVTTSAVGNGPVVAPAVIGTVGQLGINALTADPLLTTNSLRTAPGALVVAAGAGSLITPLNVDLPDLSTPYIATGAATGIAQTPVIQAFAVSQGLAARATFNEFLTTTSIAATTDWVFSMPTRRYNVAMDYTYANPLGGDGRVYTDFGSGLNFFTSANTTVSGGRICTSADSVTQRDREETTATAGFIISPAVVSTVRFCGETSVLGINNGTNTTTGSLNASLATQNINVGSNEGWIAIVHRGLDNAARGAGAWPDPVAAPLAAGVVLGGAGDTGRGLPVIGSAFAKSAAFGAAWKHRYTR